MLLIAQTVAEMPMVSRKVLRALIEPYGKPYCFTKAIFQKAQIPNARLHFSPNWTATKKPDIQRRGERFKLGLEKAMAKHGGKKVSATKIGRDVRSMRISIMNLTTVLS